MTLAQATITDNRDSMVKCFIEQKKSFHLSFLQEGEHQINTRSSLEDREMIKGCDKISGYA